MSCPDEGTLLRQVFDQQVERLVAGGWHTALEMTEKDFRLWLEMLRFDRFGGRLLDGVTETGLNNLPFLIVIPHGRLPIERQMERLVVAKKHGYPSLDSGKFTNWENVGSSGHPYIISDVDNGAGNVGWVTRDAAGEINCACRRGFIMEEAIALALHSPESLIHHAFALIDTDYQSEPWSGNGIRRQCVPELWLSSGGPTQNFSRLDSRREDRGVPSCRRRLFLDRS